MHRKDSARRSIAVVVASLLASLAGCRSPGAERPPDLRYESRPEWHPKPDVSTTWFHFTFGWLDREQDGGDPVGDGLAWGVNGGIDLAQTVLTPSLEFGISYAGSHVSVPNVDDVDLWRGTVGMRGTWHWQSWRPYVRGGGFLRWSTQDLEEPFDPYAPGVFLGAGADWPYKSGMSFGPSVVWYRSIGEDAPGGDTGEMVFMLGATFRL